MTTMKEYWKNESDADAPRIICLNVGYSKEPTAFAKVSEASYRAMYANFAINKRYRESDLKDGNLRVQEDAIFKHKRIVARMIKKVRNYPLDPKNSRLSEVMEQAYYVNLPFIQYNLDTFTHPKNINLVAIVEELKTLGFLDLA